MNIETMKKVTAYIKHADEVIGTLQKQAALHTATLDRVRELAPRIADLYVKNHYVPEALRDKTAVALSDHVRTLELVEQLVSRPSAEVPSPGRPVGEKSAADSLPAEERLKKAEEQLLKRLGIL